MAFTYEDTQTVQGRSNTPENLENEEDNDDDDDDDDDLDDPDEFGMF